MPFNKDEIDECKPLKSKPSSELCESRKSNKCESENQISNSWNRKMSTKKQHLFIFFMLVYSTTFFVSLSSQYA